MIKILYCTNCNKNKSLPFTVDWKFDYRYCDKCKQYNDKSKIYHFCSSKCMKEWVLKFVGHKHEWKSHPTFLGAYGEEDNEKIMKMCNICFMEREFKATKKDIREVQCIIKEYLGDEDEVR